MGEKRKIVKSGHTSCVVALPKKWIDANNVKPGDYVNIFQDSNYLKISTEALERKTEARIVITKEQKESMEKRIISAYLAGFSTIILHFPDGIKEYMAETQKVVDNLFGIEITKTDEKNIWLTSMIKEEDIPTNDLISRMVFLTKFMLKSSIEFVQKKDKLVMSAVKDAEVQIDKIHLTLIRHLIISGSGTAAAIPQYRMIKSLELISDYSETLLKIGDLTEKEKKDATFIGMEIFYILDKLAKDFLSSKTEDIDNLFKKMKQTKEHCNSISLSGKSAGFIEAMFTLKNILAICRDLGEITLNTEKLNELLKKSKETKFS